MGAKGEGGEIGMEWEQKGQEERLVSVAAAVVEAAAVEAAAVEGQMVDNEHEDELKEC